MSKQKSMFSFVAEVGNEVVKLIHENEEGHVLILPLRDNVIFPGTINPIIIGRKNSLATIHAAEKKNMLIGIFAQKDANIDEPEFEDLVHTGVIARVIHVMPSEQGNKSVLIQALNTIELMNLTQGKNGYEGDVLARTDIEPIHSEVGEYETTLGLIKERVNELGHMTDDFIEMFQYFDSIPLSPYYVNTLCGNLPFDMPIKINLLKTMLEIGRAQKLLFHINNLIHLAKLKSTIERKTQYDIDKQQREYFISQEIQKLQAELGNKDDNSNKLDDIAQLRNQAEKKKWNQKVAETFENEISRLTRINPQSPDYNVQLNYLQTIVSLPWDYCTESTIQVEKAERILNRDHYGMEKVKERILEHLAVLKLRKDQRSPIICLYGPPGVGKTSLGKSIAKALGRNYVRISLGGVHDESEIRGHRRTYVGAMPGRIIKGIQKAKSSNPVYILDEIDKLGSDFKGDPSSALLEALDPEQNSTFHDNYLDLDYDLSNVLFLTTANSLSPIQPALLDRMELINVSGYLAEEKAEIAKAFLLPKQLKEHGLDAKALKISAAGIKAIIDQYTHESGVRGLEKQIAKIARVTAKKIALGQEYPSVIKPEHLKEYLGLPTNFHDQQKGNEAPGVVTGLAWTQMGGEILFVESSVSAGKGVMTMTGNLGDVMKESATIAYQYIKAHPDMAKMDSKTFSEKDIHVHVPEGATPKDGPSAGITMVSSMVSALRGEPVKRGIAMTGEMTLRGRVLPVGGIKEKILAAKRAGVHTIVISEENRKDVEDIKEIYVKGLTFHYVKTISDVIDFIF